HNGSASLAERLIDQAASSNIQLHSRPTAERAEQDYLSVIEIYKRGVDADAQYHFGDEALLAMARLTEEMATDRHKPRYYYNEISYYSQLTHDYPKSPHRALALITTARIFEQYLNDKEEAARAYTEVVREFPNSVGAREAAANLSRLLPARIGASEEPLAAENDPLSGEKVITSIRNF